MHIHTKSVASMALCMDKIANERKYQNYCHLKAVSQNDKKSDSHIVGAFVHVHTHMKFLYLCVWVG